jgi:alpha-beta hydrolase superfamily lysophospholipase
MESVLALGHTGVYAPDRSEIYGRGRRVTIGPAAQGVRGENPTIAVHVELLEAPSAPALFVRVVEAAQPQAVLIFLHASLVHSEYYMPLAVRLAQQGISVWLPDLRGHGRSGGPRGHLRRWTEHREDAARVVEAAARSYAHGIPFFIGGESYGGLIAYLWARDSPDAHRGVILLSPAMGLHFRLAAHWRALLQQVVRPVWPRLRPLLPLTIRGISGDGVIEQLMARDRQVVRRYTLGFFLELFRAQEAAAEPGKDVRRPVLCWLSAGDPICDNQRAEAVLANATDLVLHTVDAPAHSLVADRAEDVADGTTAWILAHARSSPASSVTLGDP